MLVTLELLCASVAFSHDFFYYLISSVAIWKHIDICL